MNNNESKAAVGALECAWKLWYMNNNHCDQANWESFLYEIVEMKTLAEFTCVYNCAFSPSELLPACDFYFFKSGIRPTWDDPSNLSGGRWVIPVDVMGNQLNFVWREVLMALVGGWCDEMRHEICGAVLNLRKRRSKICIWTKEILEDDKIINLGRQFKTIIGHDGVISFECHRDCEMNRPHDDRIKFRI